MNTGNPRYRIGAPQPCAGRFFITFAGATLLCTAVPSHFWNFVLGLIQCCCLAQSPAASLIDETGSADQIAGRSDPSRKNGAGGTPTLGTGSGPGIGVTQQDPGLGTLQHGAIPPPRSGAAAGYEAPEHRSSRPDGKRLFGRCRACPVRVRGGQGDVWNGLCRRRPLRSGTGARRGQCQGRTDTPNRSAMGLRWSGDFLETIGGHRTT